LNVLYKTVLFRWKIPLLIISNIFKNVLYFGIFNKVKLKKRLIVKKLQFFKTLVSFLV
jgi:hypothetical protein